MNNYELNVISHHKDFNDKTLKKYYVDGINTIGVFGDEAFSIVFTNNTSQKIQVKLSLDGTDILTGNVATTDVTKDMWIVNGYAKLKLDAFPETNDGGAGFVFTSANNSVAAHTHGDMSSRGIIAAAVFVEGHVEPQRINLQAPIQHHHYHYDNYPYYQKGISYTPIYNHFVDNGRRSGGILRSNDPVSYNSSDSLPFGASEISEESSKSLESLVSVGAGEHINQKITYVTGLIKPMFTETVRVKYLWWDDLVEKLRAQTTAQAQPSGFPGDGSKKNIDLGCTPRIKKTGQDGRTKRGSFCRSEHQMFSRF